MSLSTQTQAGIGALQYFVGARGARKAEESLMGQIENLPQYTRPPEYYQQEQYYGRAKDQDIPGYGLMQQHLGASVAAGQRAKEKYATSSAALLGSAGETQMQKMDYLNQLFLQNRMYQEQMRDRYMQTLSRGEGYSEKEFALNQWYPAQLKMNLQAGKLQRAQGMMDTGFQQVGAAGVRQAGEIDQAAYTMMGLAQGTPEFFGGGGGGGTQTGYTGAIQDTPGRYGE